ncbi:RNA polymerase sigma factor [Haliangium sp.]|uniref:RNA polymerase sigma factor n=1 Tax=Haliangium sp. TaxID=2663208 RepID=UPI003D0C8BC5
MLTWLVATVLAAGVTAEALEHSGGLEPTTFGGGYWLAMGIDGLFVVWAILRRFRRHDSPWAPLAWLAVGYIVLLWFAVVPDLATDLDVPDVLTTVVLLGLQALVSYLFPLLLFVLLARATGAAWRSGRVSSVAAQRVGVLAGCIGLVGLTLAGGLVFIDLAPKSLGTALQEFADSIDVEGAEGERRVYEALSLGLESGTAARTSSSPKADGVFTGCADTLARSDGDARSVIQQAVRRLIRKGLDKSDAEDLVMETLLKVCTKHAEERRQELVPYFWAALRNATSSYRVRVYQRREWWDEQVLPDEQTLLPDARLAFEQDRTALYAAMAQLTPTEQYVLSLYADGLRHADIAARLGKSEAAVRQQVKRALDHLKRAWRRQPQSRSR